MKITKMHGAGNDFILINNLIEQLPADDLADFARQLCHRRLSVGADGLILADRPKHYGDIQMVFYNADGSKGEMCGNGARCLARFAYEQGLSPAQMELETLAGSVLAERITQEAYRVRLPNPSLIEPIRLSLDDCLIKGYYVELGQPGVPHLCVELPELDTISEETLFQLGRKLRYHPVLSKGANVNFYQQLSTGHFLERTYERGVEDFTMACGTGSASVALAVQTIDPTLRSQSIRLSVPGGEILIDNQWDNDLIRSVDLTGPTTIVFEGTLHNHQYLEEK